METAAKKNVIDAINSLGRRVTAADVALKTGLPLNVANTTLNKVAAETSGHLEVSSTGDIVYKFAAGFENKYLATGIWKTLETAGHKIFEIGYFLLRISFGIMLVVSFIAILLLILIVVIALSRMGSDGDDSGGDGGGFNFDFFDFMILRDLLWWGAWSQPNVYVDYNRPYARTAPTQKGNFLFNVFSFLFGDGNPNSHLDERKWQLIAETIQHNKGVVTAEQLAPYTGADPKDDDAVLPVLVRFDGKPEVTATGNIVYVFPSMQVHGTYVESRSGATHLREYPWPFTNVDSGALMPVYLLATFNFFGSWWLMYEQSKVIVLHMLGPLIVALTIYGTAFVMVPLFRWAILGLLNSGIESRNSKRQEYAVAVQNQSPELATKLKEAADYTINERFVSSDNLAYSTEKNALDQKDDLDGVFEQIEREVTKKAQTNSHSAHPFGGHRSAGTDHLRLADKQKAAEPGHVIDLSEKDRVEQERRDQTDNKRNQSLSD